MRAIDSDAFWIMSVHRSGIERGRRKTFMVVGWGNSFKESGDRKLKTKML